MRAGQVGDCQRRLFLHQWSGGDGDSFQARAFGDKVDVEKRDGVVQGRQGEMWCDAVWADNGVAEDADTQMGSGPAPGGSESLGNRGPGAVSREIAQANRRLMIGCYPYSGMACMEGQVLWSRHVMISGRIDGPRDTSGPSLASSRSTHNAEDGPGPASASASALQLQLLFPTSVSLSTTYASVKVSALQVEPHKFLGGSYSGLFDSEQLVKKKSFPSHGTTEFLCLGLLTATTHRASNVRSKSPYITAVAVSRVHLMYVDKIAGISACPARFTFNLMIGMLEDSVSGLIHNEPLAQQRSIVKNPENSAWWHMLHIVGHSIRFN